ncbi:MAG: hypothetical protein NVSMB31_07720 [Vulcanimicrobiaceae bacterium]
MKPCVVFSGGMSAKLDIGRTYSSQTRVEEWMTAEKAGNKGADVLSTPQLVQLIEEAAIHCVGPLLVGDQLSLGTHIDLEHRKPVPVGFIVRTEVEVVQIDGPRITFAVQVFDEQENVAEGTHERYIIERAKFISKLEDKLS